MQEEIIPLLKQELEPMMEQLKGKYRMEMVYDKENGLFMNVVENAESSDVSMVTQQDKTTARDTTKYSIDGGEPLKKRRFVLAVVK